MTQGALQASGRQQQRFVDGQRRASAFRASHDDQLDIARSIAGYISARDAREPILIAADPFLSERASEAFKKRGQE